MTGFDLGTVGFPSPERLLPHKAPMVLIDEISAWDGSCVVVRARVRARQLIVVDGLTSTLMCIEYMAQAVGCAEGLLRRAEGTPAVHRGLLLGTREAVFDVGMIAVGEELTISATSRFSGARMASYACNVVCGTKRVAHAELNVYVGDDAEKNTGE